MSSLFGPLKKAWRATPFAGAPAPVVSVIELNGVIGDIGPSRRGLSLSRLEKAIEAAFKPDDLKAVALSINSPGGSPVQSRLILQKIRQLAREKDKPVLAFIEDVGASGGYILALAGDEIYADESSIVGSIGVISAGFGFQEAIARLGVERRVYTAGENKGMLDPFQHEKADEVSRLNDILQDLHAQFIALVKDRRDGKLPADESAGADELFSGLFWTGAGAKQRGLIDGIAQLGEFARARYGKDVKLKKYSPDSGSLLRKLFAGDALGRQPALFDADALLEAAEARALWARYGL